MCLFEDAVVERLRGLDRPYAGAVEILTRFMDQAVGHGDGKGGGLLSLQCLYKPVDRIWVNEGSCTVMDQNYIILTHVSKIV
jgi:hypothetical protein